MDLGPEIQKLLKDKTITNKTIDRVFIAKNYIEKKYQMKKVIEEERKKGKIKFLYTFLNIYYLNRLGRIQ